MTRLQDVYDKKQIPVFVMRQKRPPEAGLLALDKTRIRTGWTAQSFLSAMQRGH
jgi:hypothetical protein